MVKVLGNTRSFTDEYLIRKTNKSIVVKKDFDGTHVSVKIPIEKCDIISENDFTGEITIDIEEYFYLSQINFFEYL